MHLTWCFFGMYLHIKSGLPYTVPKALSCFGIQIWSTLVHVSSLEPCWTDLHFHLQVVMCIDLFVFCSVSQNSHYDTTNQPDCIHNLWYVPMSRIGVCHKLAQIQNKHWISEKHPTAFPWVWHLALFPGLWSHHSLLAVQSLHVGPGLFNHWCL